MSLALVTWAEMVEVVHRLEQLELELLVEEGFPGHVYCPGQIV